LRKEGKGKEEGEGEGEGEERISDHPISNVIHMQGCTIV
jgi:hypothetical protein